MARTIETASVTSSTFGKEIVAQISRTQEGIALLIAGGDKSHIGAVAVVDSDGKSACIILPSHKDHVIAEKWAKELWQRFMVQAVVSVGIHYDVVNKEMIEEILKKTDEMMEELLHE